MRTDPILLPTPMQFERLMSGRRSVRAFTDEPVDRATLDAVMRMALRAPSNSNTQPWRVEVLMGEAKRSLGSALREACAQRDAPAYSHFPETLPEPLAVRQADFGARYYGSLGIDRHDGDARQAQTLRNYDFFGAPVGLIITTHRSLRAHSWLDCGIFLQSLLLAAEVHGLATCPQVSFARFDTLIGHHLQLAADQQVLCGVSLGYADETAGVNRAGMPRLGMEEVVRFRA